MAFRIRRPLPGAGCAIRLGSTPWRWRERWSVVGWQVFGDAQPTAVVQHLCTAVLSRVLPSSSHGVQPAASCSLTGSATGPEAGVCRFY